MREAGCTGLSAALTQSGSSVAHLPVSRPH
jgi:hypothetical protein